MSSTYGADRKKIYDYLESKGLKVTDEVHEELKQMLLDYVNKQNENLLSEAKAYRKHMVKCELFLAKRQARKDRKKVLTNVK